MTVPEDFVEAFAELCADDQLVDVRATRYAWWCLVAAVQLASRHPQAVLTQPIRHAIQLAFEIGADITRGSEPLERIISDGWDNTQDDVPNPVRHIPPPR